MRDEVRENKQKRMAAILPGVLRDRGWQAQMELHSIFLQWAKVVDETVSAHAQPLKIVKGTLWVEVENSAWLQQLQYQKVSVLKSINDFFQEKKISDIRFVLPQLSGQEPPKEHKVRFAAPPPEELKRFEEQAASIEDEATRNALVRFWYLSKACIREE
ncbi:DUF721 domain-containing protein [Desulfopila aestuarii]|uniref:DUF721 domain-containing protein n=1 Tax=Desulfopila aestuarii DSM 18488 TaxID=1121416 RepID=A0A1M7YFX7_9BACT|nr:DUF721 domain-containing protein [Desulfopila aestuarii]SHO51418.1 hypothetical protein SAMN02745220_03998 [Desulfopila aestuarii DSM 18488]